MNSPYKKEHWCKELDSHIKCFYAYNKQRKTILINRETPHFYSVVTRVNYNTTMLWIDYVNEIIKNIGGNKFEKQRFGWLAEQRNYKKEFTHKIKLAV